LGLQEIGSLSETEDYDEVGEVAPQMRALTAINPNSVHVPVTRVAGVTTALTVPQDGLFPGTAALVNLHGYTPEQMFAGFEGVVLNFPSSARRGWWDQRTDGEVEEQFEEAMGRLDETWRQAVLFARIDSAAAAEGGPREPLYQPEMEALLPVVRGRVPLLVEVNKASDILKALEWLDGKGADAVLTGVA